MKRTNIYLPIPCMDQLKALSEKTGLSMSELIRRAIEDFFKGQK